MFHAKDLAKPEFGHSLVPRTSLSPNLGTLLSQGMRQCPNSAWLSWFTHNALNARKWALTSITTRPVMFPRRIDKQRFLVVNLTGFHVKVSFSLIPCWYRGTTSPSPSCGRSVLTIIFTLHTNSMDPTRDRTTTVHMQPSGSSSAIKFMP